MFFSKKAAKDEIEILRKTILHMRSEYVDIQNKLVNQHFEIEKQYFEIAIKEKIIADLEEGVTSLEDTNRRLNRRVSQIESPWQKERDISRAKEVVWKNAWKEEHNRLSNSFNLFKELYKLCADVLSLPATSFHSVNDCSYAKQGDPYMVWVTPIHNNVVMPMRITDVVKNTIDSLIAREQIEP